MTTPLPVGKLPADLLADLLKRYIHTDPRVIVGPGIGEDATVLDMGDTYLVAKTDPITFATDEIGWYAVHVNANDVASMGAIPRWFLATILLPQDQASAALAESIFRQLHEACNDLGVTLCGGHTEITYGLDRPVVVGQMLGEVARDELVTSAGARPGDAVLLTKGIAVEGTSIIAREMADRLRDRYDARWIARCQDFLHRPGISVVRDARIAVQAGRVHAMHDPTEGGLSTGLYELAVASKVSLVIEAAAVPVLPETQALCAEFDLDPLGLIASGALLIVVDPEDANQVMAALQQAGVAASRIGEVQVGDGEVWLRRGADLSPFPRFSRDEITRLFE